MDFKYNDGGIYLENENGKIIAEADIRKINENEVDIVHVYVDPSLRGHGLAGDVMEEVTNYLRKNNLKAEASCSYANLWFMRNREKCKDVISPGIRDSLSCRIDGKR